MKLSYVVTSALRRLLRAAVDRHACSGSFRHRGVHVSHPGILLNQEDVAGLIDGAVGELTKAGHEVETVCELLERTEVRVIRERPLLDGMPVEQFCRWTGGLRDRGEIVLRFDERWLERLTTLLRALLLHELAPGQVGRPERVF